MGFEIDDLPVMFPCNCIIEFEEETEEVLLHFCGDVHQCPVIVAFEAAAEATDTELRYE